MSLALPSQLIQLSVTCCDRRIQLIRVRALPLEIRLMLTCPGQVLVQLLVVAVGHVRDYADSR